MADKLVLIRIPKEHGKIIDCGPKRNCYSRRLILPVRDG